MPNDHQKPNEQTPLVLSRSAVKLACVFWVRLHIDETNKKHVECFRNYNIAYFLTSQVSWIVKAIICKLV